MNNYMKTLICDYCNKSINRTMEPVMETRIVDDRLSDSCIVEVAHRRCWMAVNIVVRTVIGCGRDILTEPAFIENSTDGVDKKSSVS